MTSLCSKLSMLECYLPMALSNSTVCMRQQLANSVRQSVIQTCYGMVRGVPLPVTAALFNNLSCFCSEPGYATSEDVEIRCTGVA